MGEFARRVGVVFGGAAVLAAVGGALIYAVNHMPHTSDENADPIRTTPPAATSAAVPGKPPATKKLGFTCTDFRLVTVSRGNYEVSAAAEGTVPEDARLSVFADFDGNNKDRTVVSEPGQFSVEFSEFRALDGVSGEIVSGAGTVACGSVEH
jgi:hypothetical protein